VPFLTSYVSVFEEKEEADFSLEIREEY